MIVRRKIRSIIGACAAALLCFLQVQRLHASLLQLEPVDAAGGQPEEEETGELSEVEAEAAETNGSAGAPQAQFSERGRLLYTIRPPVGEDAAQIVPGALQEGEAAGSQMSERVSPAPASSSAKQDVTRQTEQQRPGFVSEGRMPPGPPIRQTEPIGSVQSGGRPTDRGSGILLNFKDAPLEQVLNYLSEAAGFVVVQETPVSGTVSITSHSPLSRDEVVDLLNSVLVDKGYALVAIGRILKIVPRNQASQYPVPVQVGSDPNRIPATEQVVTQIMPVRHLNAAKLVEVLQPIFSPTAKVTADEASNSLIVTDTMLNIRRLAQILYALDSSIAGITTVRVFQLQYADATELAQVINQLFQQQGQQQSRQPAFGGPPFMRFGGDRGAGAGQGGNESPARAAASRVVAVGDERTNSLIVAAPDELMPTIEALVNQIDSPADEPIEIRSFALQNADAVEMASLINDLFSNLTRSTTTTARGRFGFQPGMPPIMIASQGQSQSSRRAQQMTVVAVGDPRTNTLIVSASRDMMIQIAELVGRLDSDASRKQQVYVYPLEHADPSAVAEILQRMFEENRTGRTTSTRVRSTTGQTSALRQRQSSGATLNSGFGTGSAFGSGASTRQPSR